MCPLPGLPRLFLLLRKRAQQAPTGEGGCHANTHTHTHTYIYAHTYTYIMHIHTSVHTYTHAQCTHTLSHTHTHTHTHTHKLMNTCSCLPTHSGRKRGAPSLGMCPGQAAACGAGDHTQGAHQCCLGSSVVVCAVMFAVCRAPLNSVLKSTRKERISAALAAQ